MSDKTEQRLEDLVMVAEALLKNLKKKPAAEQRPLIVQAKAPQVTVAPEIKVEVPAAAPADVIVNVPKQEPCKPRGWTVEVHEWGGPERRISKMTFTPIE